MRLKDRSWLRRSPAWREAVTATCERFGVTEELLLGRSHIGSLCTARGHCYTILRGHGWSYPDIGAAFGRNHAAILRAVRFVRWEQERLEQQAALRHPGDNAVAGVLLGELRKVEQLSAADCAAWKAALG